LITKAPKSVRVQVEKFRRNSSGTGVDFAGQNPPNDLT